MSSLETKKMSTRSSSSNLCKLANVQVCETQNNISNPVFADNQQSKIKKNYTLDVGKSLEKKLSGCASDHLTFDMKPRENNLVI